MDLLEINLTTCSMAVPPHGEEEGVSNIFTNCIFFPSLNLAIFLNLSFHSVLPLHTPVCSGLHLPTPGNLHTYICKSQTHTCPRKRDHHLLGVDRHPSLVP